jgi:capsid protein
MSEDNHLDQTDRRKLIAGVRTLRRNFSVAAWMVRRHLDYVSSFRFQPRTGSDDVNKVFAGLVNRDSRAARAHSRERFPLPRMIRMAELLRTVDGDLGWTNLASGQVQLIEGDRVRNPNGVDGFNKKQWRHGVRVDDYGKPMEYAVHGRMDGGSMFVFERFVPAANMILHGYFDREDQTRGVSPLATAYNELTDAYEFHDYTRARAKVQSLFGLKLTRADENPADHIEQTNEEGSDQPRYSIDYGKGLFQLELEPGDNADWLESQHPTSQLQAYIESVLLLALKSLDLPYSFFREDFTNFFGSRGAWLLYDRACEPKREDNRELLNAWTRWKLIQWIIRGELTLPEGKTIDDEPWEWVPRKVPAFKRIEDIKADILALQAGLTTPEGICREDDEGTFRENIRDIADALDFAKSQGVNVAWSVEDNPDLPSDEPTIPGESPEETPSKEARR